MNSHKTHCKYGHPLSGDNLRVKRKNRSGKIYVERECKTCHAADNRIYHGMKRLRTTEARLEAMK